MMVEELYRALFASSLVLLLYVPIILLLMMWSKETPTLERGKDKGR